VALANEFGLTVEQLQAVGGSYWVKKWMEEMGEIPPERDSYVTSRINSEVFAARGTYVADFSGQGL
jgi:hypothetical protein